MSPEAILHASAGALGILTGAVTLWAGKGERLHRRAGTLFFAVMLATAITGVYLGLASNDLNNAIAGVVTLYLLLTGWVAVRRRDGEAGLFELGAFLFAAAGGAIAFYSAISAIRAGDAMLGGIPYVTIASIITLAALLDLSVVVRRGISGRQRIARHLWRLLLGFSAAVGSFFPGQLEIFPAYIREVRPIIILFIPFFMVIGLLFFWLVRVLFTDWRRFTTLMARAA